MGKALDDFVKRFLEDPEVPEGSKEGVRDLWESQLPGARKFRDLGMLHKALAKYAKEHDRPIRSSIDAEIVQLSHIGAGEICRELDDLDQAVAHFEKALQLLRIHRVSSYRHLDLAQIYIEQGRFDEAVELCQELIGSTPSQKGQEIIQDTIDKAVALKKKSAG